MDFCLLALTQMNVALATGQCVHSVCNTLAMWERMGKFSEYVEFLYRHLIPIIRSGRRTEVDDRLWRQLIVVAIVFCLNLIEVRVDLVFVLDCFAVIAQIRLIFWMIG